MSPHAFIPNPMPARASQRTIFIRTSRPWWRRRSGAIAAAVAIAGLVVATSWVIGRMEATQAQLQAAYSHGMAAGMHFCPGR